MHLTRRHHPVPTSAEPQASQAANRRPHRSANALRSHGALLAVLVLTAPGCATGEPEMRDPRRLVVHSGERLSPTRERMEEIEGWFHEQVDSIVSDESFWVIHGPQEGPAYLWETLEVNEQGDTAHIYYQRPELVRTYTRYAYLHIMVVQGRLGLWLPEAEGGTPYEIERAILSQVADAWLYERSIYDTRPYDLLDELTYSKENDYLDAYILTARPDEFVDARRIWMEENPGARDAFIAWFRNAFERDPPGVRGGS